ncbi:uncharacterized protein LOC125006381 [Mugil cephalus]|uniref:uncharacterized protein LOC125006381 n=1 Tax=Mugil cephalus TaxID=48193 RepID=UPI001FB5B1F7|nr:uncharacterized protein LOC125006381 [Mugil cephalus]
MRTNTSRAVSCLKPLTGTELLSMSQQSSPAEVEVTCYYTVERRGEQHPSPHSNRASISILKLTDTSPSTTTQEMTTQTITSFRMTTGQTVTMSRSSFGSRSTSLKETVSRGTTRPGTGALTLGLFPVTTPEASSGKCSDKRLQASVTGESVNMTSVDPGELVISFWQVKITDPILLMCITRLLWPLTLLSTSKKKKKKKVTCREY